MCTTRAEFADEEARDGVSRLGEVTPDDAGVPLGEVVRGRVVGAERAKQRRLIGCREECGHGVMPFLR